MSLSTTIQTFTTIQLDPFGKICHQQEYSTNYLIEDLGDGLKLELVSLQGGVFTMGSPETELGSTKVQRPLHSVQVKPFAMGKYPITQAQWHKVAKLPKVERTLPLEPSNFIGNELPIEQVSWLEAVEFCLRLSEYTGRKYRLPTEAEWEYACRGNTGTPFYFGETITTDVANYSGVNWEYDGKICTHGSYGKGPIGCDRRQTTPVGTVGYPNSFGIYHLHGLVREWCADYWHSNYRGAPEDGSVWEGEDSDYRVIRGGSWNTPPVACRSGHRSKFEAEAGLYDIGFRVVMDIS